MSDFRTPHSHTVKRSSKLPRPEGANMRDFRLPFVELLAAAVWRLPYWFFGRASCCMISRGIFNAPSPCKKRLAGKSRVKLSVTFVGVTACILG